VRTERSAAVVPDPNRLQACNADDTTSFDNYTIFHGAEFRMASGRRQCTIWGRKNLIKGNALDHAANERIIELVEPMNKAQEVDYAYQEENLLRLLVRRQALPANSARLPDLTCEIMAVENLVRSYRIVRAAHMLKA
jgi:hypothetical protein